MNGGKRERERGMKERVRETERDELGEKMNE